MPPIPKAAFMKPTLTFGAPLLALLLACGPVLAQQDRTAERNARRAQLQTQALQQQVQQAQADKVKAETEVAELRTRIQAGEEQIARAQTAQRAADARLKATEADRAALSEKLAAMEKSMDERQRNADQALAAKDRDLTLAAQQLKAQGEAQTQLQARFADQVRMVTECSEKNDRLIKIGVELIDRYRNKGFVESVKQREPMLGLSDVQTFNLLQDYRDRADAERFVPSSERR
jgi:chromosome segregation ATPase